MFASMKAIYSEVHLNIYAADVKIRRHFQYKNWWGIGYGSCFVVRQCVTKSRMHTQSDI